MTCTGMKKAGALGFAQESLLLSYSTFPTVLSTDSQPMIGLNKSWQTGNRAVLVGYSLVPLVERCVSIKSLLRTTRLPWRICKPSKCHCYLATDELPLPRPHLWFACSHEWECWMTENIMGSSSPRIELWSENVHWSFHREDGKWNFKKKFVQVQKVLNSTHGFFSEYVFLMNFLKIRNWIQVKTLTSLYHKSTGCLSLLLIKSLQISLH